MEEKFQNKYRIPSNRLRGWNYAANGHYFITIVTHGRNQIFGHVENGEMILTDIGRIVYAEFFKSFEIRSELYLGEFVLMPNHLHAIVILDKPNCELDEKTPTKLQRQPKSISSFVAGFKSSTIKQIDDWIDTNGLSLLKYNSHNPLWQANYYDHIIRNEKEYQTISEYIVCNPMKWEDDTLRAH